MRLLKEPDRKHHDSTAAIGRELLADARHGAGARSDALPALATKARCVLRQPLSLLVCLQPDRPAVSAPSRSSRCR